jgi:metallo-beta-lactamase family protein
VGRTQEIVYSLNKFFNQGKLPRIEIYVDSPLAVNATTIFRMHPECFNKEILKVMETDSDPFGFNSLTYITRQEDSKKLNDSKKPCIIISASGMMEAGRIKHHLANNISNPQNTILVVGYCSPVTLGARIVSGDKEVSIFGTVYRVNAEVKSIDSFSGHGDYNEMIDFLSCQNKSELQKTFLVHGEYETQVKYSARLQESGFNNIQIPAMRQEFII